MQQNGNLNANEEFNLRQVLEFAQQKITRIDWKKAKEDVLPFISHPNQVNSWSHGFFSELIKKVQV